MELAAGEHSSAHAQTHLLQAPEVWCILADLNHVFSAVVVLSETAQACPSKPQTSVCCTAGACKDPRN